jgi:hypothetical protein
MIPKLFKLVCQTGDLRIASLSRETCPEVGDALVVFNCPVIERYVVERLEKRNDWRQHDWFDPYAVVVRFDCVLQSAASRGNVVAFNQDGQIDTRLSKIEKVARQTIDEKLTLEITHADFVALCVANGLTVDAVAIDIFAYRDIPMKVGAKDEVWNSATAFHGFSDDAHVLYVTWPCGTPFVMNARLLEVAKAHYGCQLSTEMALAQALAVAVEAGAAETRGLENAMREMFSLMGEGIMPVYDGAQELTRMTLPSYAATLEKTWADRDPRPVIENAKYVEVSGIARVDVGGLVDLFSGLKPVRH